MQSLASPLDAMPADLKLTDGSIAQPRAMLVRRSWPARAA